MFADMEIGELFGSPLHLASLVGNTRIIMLLLGKLRHEDANTEWGGYGTALDVAKVLNNDEAVDLLKEWGLNEKCDELLTVKAFQSLSLFSGCSGW
ncbi:hypothetical protein B0H17DRAFT_1064776 [Mycena rosella]|uniref:Uncharacterized protein n=1 Tax=Mycena rosella TaxID=1033263 RepID=A0AAD7GEB1_MYCRO|nr:hypothetical protein B0H17DRAFT_1064776 [Mycena rosella]